MDFSNLTLYKVIEAQRVVAIVPRDGIVPGANNLIIGTMDSVMYFLPRYIDARMRGADPRAALAYGLEGAIINQGTAVLGAKDAPGT